MTDAEEYDIEFLNSIDISGIPAHDLKIKVGCIIMLMRNLDKPSGAVNGNKLIVKSCSQYIILGEFLDGPMKGQEYLIPRINIRNWR